MEPCNRVIEWLEQSSPPDFSNIPGHLSDHLAACPVCKKTVSFFRKLALDENYPCISSNEANEFIKEFQSKALGAAQESASPTLPMTRLLHWPRICWAFAGALSILLLVIGSALFFRSSPTTKREDVQTFAILKGKASLVSSVETGSVAAPGSDQNIIKETEIKFDSPPEPITVQYQNGGKVLLSGIGHMKILKDGLNVESGKFNAQFKNLAGILKVRVPCAVLAIRGTEIQFTIQPPTGEILLVEGAADLTPDNPSFKPIRLEKGKKVLLADNVWSSSRSSTQPSSSGDKKPGATPVPVASNSQIPDSRGNMTPDIPEKPTDEASTPEEIASGSMLETGEEPTSFGREGFEH